MHKNPQPFISKVNILTFGTLIHSKYIIIIFTLHYIFNFFVSYFLIDIWNVLFILNWGLSWLQVKNAIDHGTDIRVREIAFLKKIKSHSEVFDLNSKFSDVDISFIVLVCSLLILHL